MKVKVLTTHTNFRERTPVITHIKQCWHKTIKPFCWQFTEQRTASNCSSKSSCCKVIFQICRRLSWKKRFFSQSLCEVKPQLWLGSVSCYLQALITKSVISKELMLHNHHFTALFNRNNWNDFECRLYWAKHSVVDVWSVCHTFLMHTHSPAQDFQSLSSLNRGKFTWGWI